MRENAIEVCDVWKRFRRGELHDSLRDFVPSLTRRLLRRGTNTAQLAAGDFWALQGISFQLKRGEALGIIGPNGAGKSTMLKILSRILRPNRGHIQINGRLSALIEVAAGFHSDLTGRENIYLNGAILGMKKREIDSKIKGIIEFSGIESFIDTPVKRYSSGMQARLGFSVMAHMDPEILLVDEVLSVGDVAFRTKCLRHMTNLLRSEVSVIFISHNLDQVRQLCDRCIVLDKGRMQYIGDVDEAFKQYMTCLRGQNEPSAQTAELELLHSAGNLLGLTMFDQQGSPTSAIPSHSPVTFEITYHLRARIDQIGIVMNIEKADGSHIARLTTMQDKVSPPAQIGKNTLHLSIDGLPFHGGDYVISLRLFDTVSGQSIDVHRHRYPLVVLGPEHDEQVIYIQHKWLGDERGVEAG
ncbi:MAG: ABC transporter ATP-binding protein [Candidatus Tectimicrobiota bacterium]